MYFHTPTLHVCNECCHFDWRANRCTNPKSLSFGNGVYDGQCACPSFASQTAAWSRLPKRKKYVRIRHLWQAELPNARW